jgi:hypothetical protein
MSRASVVDGKAGGDRSDNYRAHLPGSTEKSSTIKWGRGHYPLTLEPARHGREGYETSISRLGWWKRPELSPFGPSGAK